MGGEFHLQPLGEVRRSDRKLSWRAGFAEVIEGDCLSLPGSLPLPSLLFNSLFRPDAEATE